MKDMNGIDIKLGSIVKIDNSYFKIDSGYWFVTRSDSDLTLRKINKNGKISVTEKVCFWPLKSFCSDHWKNVAANQHNKANATIQVVSDIPSFDVSRWFAEEAAKYRELADDRMQRGWAESEYSNLVELAETFERVAADNQCAAPEKKVETGIKFYWNGIKVDGGRLISCTYGIDGDNVRMYASKYNSKLPGRYFDVENYSDSMTDYFEYDHATITPEHPLYKYAYYYACAAAAKSAKQNMAYCEKRLAQTGNRYYEQQIDSYKSSIERFDGMVNPGQPTEDDYKAIDALRIQKKQEREAKEAEERAAAEAEMNKRIADGKKFIEETMEKYPIIDGEPVVTFLWSENPAFYAWEDCELKTSLMAADIILAHYDTKIEVPKGYDKTKIMVSYFNPETNEEEDITDRYGLGDMEFKGLAGLIEAWENQTLVWMMCKAKARYAA